MYHTLDTQKSMKSLFGHPVSKYRLRPCREKGFFLYKTYHVESSKQISYLHNAECELSSPVGAHALSDQVGAARTLLQLRRGKLTLHWSIVPRPIREQLIDHMTSIPSSSQKQIYQKLNENFKSPSNVR